VKDKSWALEEVFRMLSFHRARIPLLLRVTSRKEFAQYLEMFTVVAQAELRNQAYCYSLARKKRGPPVHGSPSRQHESARQIENRKAKK